MAVKLRRGCMDKLESGLNGVYIETSVITLTTISLLAITGELLTGLKIIQEPAYSKVDQSQDEVTKPTTIEPGGATVESGGVNLSYNMNIVNTVCHYISLVIAALFLLEILLKIFSRGRSFFVFPWQVLDGFIVIAVIGIEITFTFVSVPQPYWEAVTYIVILRYWRIAYVCNIRADARQIEFEQELETWRAAKQKSDENCRTLQYKLDQYKVENMINTKTNGHIPSMTTDVRKDSPIVNGVDITVKTVANGIITPSHTHGHNATVLADNIDGAVNHIKPVTDDDTIVVENVKRVKTVNFDMTLETEVSPLSSPLTTRHREISAYSRTDSESSISYQATEEEVVVQIENAIQSEMSPTDDVTCLIPEENLNKENYAFVNETFEDLDDLVFRKDLQVMADIDGTKTYRSADGIPMTSL